MSHKKLIEIYLEYWNDFLSIEGYARFYGLPLPLAESLINHAREVYRLTNR